jgi:hypothetical protein
MFRDRLGHTGWFVLAATAGALVVVLMGTAIAHPEGPENPFAAYERIMPGQSARILSDFPCTYSYIVAYSKPAMSYCHIRLTHGTIRHVGVLIADERIYRVSFSTHNLSMGYLVNHFNRPNTVMQRGTTYIACWEDGILVTASGNSFNMNTRVHYVSLVSPDDHLPSYPPETRPFDNCKAYNR